VLLFGRRPEPGRAKTRLIPALGAAGAAELYRGFLDDLAARLPAVGPVELWAPAGEGVRRALETRYPWLAVRVQPEGDLGDRLAAAFEAAFADGIDYAVAVGSDHPTLPPEYVERAFRALHAAHLVLGPTLDGGYYAIGLRRLCWPRARALFAGAPWSTPELLDWSRRRATELELCHVELPGWYDVDEPEDLARLDRDLMPGSATGRAWRGLRDGADRRPSSGG